MGLPFRLLAALLLTFALALPATAREEIRNFAANVVLALDGTVTVTETIDVQAEGEEIRRGIYRDIPVTLLGPEGGKIRPGFEVLDVQRDGQPEPYRIERMGDFQRIWIGNPDAFISTGKHRYRITYTMTRMARTFENHDELYWNATGNYWIFPIVTAVATVTLPEGAVISETAGYTGPVGSTEKAVTINRTSENTATFRTTRPLGPGEGMSFVLAFQKGVLTLPTGVDAWLQWLSDLREVIFPVLAALLVLAYNAIAWLRVGRDPDKGIIIPLFYAPKGFSPALTHYVHKWGFANSGWTAFTAAIFDLGVKGLVTIDNSAKDLRVTVTGKRPDEPLPPGEQLVFSYFEAKGDTMVDKANGPALEKRKAEFVSAIERENRTRWFRNNVGYSVLGYAIAIAVLGALVISDVLDPAWLVASIVIGIMLGIVGTSISKFWQGTLVSRIMLAVVVVIIIPNFFGMALESFTQISVNTASIAAISIVVITVVFAVLMRAPTIQGRKVMDEIDGFKLYLETAEKERLNMTGAPPMSVERFERILPYAIALGVEKPWSQHFENELERNTATDTGGTSHLYSPGWYRGSSFSSGSVSNAVSAAAAGMTAAMVAAQPVQASSSGFSSSGGGGGGGSGGGGGGGGGGGW